MRPRLLAALLAMILPTLVANAKIAAAQRHQMDVTAKYAAIDLTTFLKPRHGFIGFIGPNYQRLQIVFTAVGRGSGNPGAYRVDGFDIVKGLRTNFSGEIVVTKIIMGPPDDYGEKGHPDTAGRKWQGSIKSHYQLREQQDAKTSGIFEGTLSTDVYVDQSNRLRYDDIDVDADGYSNNHYVGLWKSYRPGSTGKVANWGEYRIPRSGDLDVGAGEFWPNDKYRKYGWSDYRLPSP